MTVRRPGPIVRRLLRSPALLYDCNVGWLLGHRFLRLTHTGRQSGRRYQTMLEVIGTGPAPGEVIVIAGLGRSADWYRNVQAPRRPRSPSGGTVFDRCTALLTRTRPVADTPDPPSPELRMRAAYRAEVVDGCVRCRWHGSEFRLTDGKVMRGPAAAPQPAWRV